jgi:folate-binding protein YgfZ
MPATLLSIALVALKKYAIFYQVSLEAIPFIENPNIIPQALRESLQNKLMAGEPSLYPTTSGKFLPHELNLQKLNAISFSKGCYTGQEIIARMHYRGKLKTHLFQAKISGHTSPDPGTELYYQSSQGIQPGGTIIDSAPMTSEDDQQQTHLILLICDAANASDHRLFLDENLQIPVIFLSTGNSFNG